MIFEQQCKGSKNSVWIRQKAVKQSFGGRCYIYLSTKLPKRFIGQKHLQSEVFFWIQQNLFTLSLYPDPNRLSYASSRQGVILVTLELQLLNSFRNSKSTVNAVDVQVSTICFDFSELKYSGYSFSGAKYAIYLSAGFFSCP